jgi:transposase
MATPVDGFSAWLTPAQIAEAKLSPAQRGMLLAAFALQQRCGRDYYSTRLLSHFLLHADTGLKVAQLARLLRLSRPTASRQQGLSSKQAIQAAQHRMAGRAYGKLLPRYAGALAEFILAHPDATRSDVLDFLQRAWGVRVSTVALHPFLKRYGLDRAARAAARVAVAAPPPPPQPTPPLAPSPVPVPSQPARAARQPGQAVPVPAPPFSGHGRSTPAPSC